MLLPIAALERPSVSAAPPTRRVAHAHYADTVRHVHEATMPAATAAPAPTPPADPSAASGTSGNADLLREHHADDRMHRAVERYRAGCGCEGVNWGLLDCLLPTQAYRVALPAAPVEILDAVAPPALRQMAVSAPQRAALDEGFESSRQRRQLPGRP